MPSTLAFALAACTTILSAADLSPDAALGRRLFDSQCSICHGVGGSGGRGPSLNRPKLAKAPDTDTLRTVIAKGIEPEMPRNWQLSPRELESVILYVQSLGTIAPETLTGDAERGRQAYAKLNCSGCHILAGEGVSFGPDLSEIGVRRSAAHLRESLRKPAAAVPDGFLMMVAVSNQGSKIRGLRLNEDTFSVQLMEPGGRVHSLRKAELRSLERLTNQSPMPAYDKLSNSEIEDLVAFLASARGRR